MVLHFLIEMPLPFCTDQMQGEGFLSDILLHGVPNEGEGVLAGIGDLNIPMTQETKHQDDVEEVPATRCTKGSKRTKNFVFQEDEVICNGWLKVSKDPIHGANQTRASFWKKVHSYFEKSKETAVVRTQSSIMHRWLAIQLSVNKYCACMEAIERRNQSGLTIQNKVFRFVVIFNFGLFYMMCTLTNLFFRSMKLERCTRHWTRRRSPLCLCIAMKY